MGDSRIAQKRGTRNGMGSSSTNNQAEHQACQGPVVRLTEVNEKILHDFSRSAPVLQLSGLEHCLSPASSQGE